MHNASSPNNIYAFMPDNPELSKTHTVTLISHMCTHCHKSLLNSLFAVRVPRAPPVPITKQTSETPASDAPYIFVALIAHVCIQPLQRISPPFWALQIQRISPSKFN